MTARASAFSESKKANPPVVKRGGDGLADSHNLSSSMATGAPDHGIPAQSSTSRSSII